MMPFASLIGAKEPENVAEPDHVVFTPGTYDWTVPAGVFEIAAVAIGSGMNGTGGRTSPSRNPAAGKGADLRWINRVAVRPGETLRIIVAASPSTEQEAGLTSAIMRRGEVILSAAGGQIFGVNPADTIGQSSTIGTRPNGEIVGGGDGGQIGTDGRTSSPSRTNGGSGAGGYSGNGGDGQRVVNGVWTAPTAGTGGAAGGGGSNEGSNVSWSGGGVGVMGEGPSGAPATTSNSGLGSGGSGGGDRSIQPSPSTGAGTLMGPNFGSGAGAVISGNGTINWMKGGPGAVRILWGKGPRNGSRAFPASNVSTATA